MEKANRCFCSSGRIRPGWLYGLFVLILLAEGIFFAVRIPFGQIPDEITHYQLMESEFGTAGYVDQMIRDVFVPGHYDRIQTQPGVKVDRKAEEEIWERRFSPELSLSFRPGLGVVRHLPAGVGFYIGVLLNAPILVCAMMAEICSVLFFAGMGLLTLRTAPVRKEIFAFCFLLPMTLQQCASVNYDAVLLPCSFFLFAYVLKLVFGETPVGWKQLAVVALLTGVILLIKPPYALLSLLVLMIPAERYSLPVGKKLRLEKIFSRYRFAALGLAAAAVGAGLFLFRNSPVVKTILADILNLPAFLGLAVRTAAADGMNYILQLVGNFGWLDSRVSDFYVICFFLILVLMLLGSLDRKKWHLSWKRRLFLALVSVAVILMILIALQEYTYGELGWDRTAGLEAWRRYVRDCPRIQGIQGRYLLPVLPVCMMMLSVEKPVVNRKVLWVLLAGFWFFTFFHVAGVLNLRYG